jgi:hypothetical protein
LYGWKHPRPSDEGLVSAVFFLLRTAA